MITIHVKRSILVVALSVASLLNAGCSSNYFEQPKAQSLPVLPEIIRPARRRPPQKNIVKKPSTSSASVRRYSVNDSKVTDSVITQKEVNSVILKSNGEATNNSADPYASIPEDSSSVVFDNSASKPINIKVESSPAVKSLLIRAQADLAIGRTSPAISKLERGLRIESQNTKLWGLLAKAHYDKSDYRQAIAMAKKSILYSSDESLIEKNWALIKKAGLQSGDTTVVKEANNYIKLNP